LRKKPSGSIGSTARRSIWTNAASSTAAPISSATIAVVDQPSSFARRSARTSRNRPPVSAAWPAQSTLRGVGSLDSRTHTRVARRVAMPIGMLT